MPDNSNTSHPLLVIVGMAGSGKSTAAHHLEKKGWCVIRFGGITMRELESRGMDINEVNEKAVREELRATHGMAAYAKVSLSTIRESLETAPTVIDGLYSWSEYRYLKQQFGERMTLVATIAARSARYARLSQRPDRPLTPEEAESRDFAEIENVEKGGPIAIADHAVLNDSAPEDMLRALDALLSRLKPGES
jgi:dephospho-CoA kinase